jgi:hypothetical protein
MNLPIPGSLKIKKIENSTAVLIPQRSIPEVTMNRVRPRDRICSQRANAFSSINRMVSPALRHRARPLPLRPPRFARRRPVLDSQRPFRPAGPLRCAVLRCAVIPHPPSR